MSLLQQWVIFSTTFLTLEIVHEAENQPPFDCPETTASENRVKIIAQLLLDLENLSRNLKS